MATGINTFSGKTVPYIMLGFLGIMNFRVVSDLRNASKPPKRSGSVANFVFNWGLAEWKRQCEDGGKLQVIRLLVWLRC